MRLYHGTSAANAAAIRREGLLPGTFVTSDLEWAEIYAARGVRRDGVPGNRTGLIVTLDAEPHELRRDPDEDGRKYDWMVLLARRPAVALRPIRVKLGRIPRQPITATSPTLPEWAGFPT